MNRRGFALLLVLWLLVAVTSLVGVTLAGARSGSRLSLNRVALLRGAWAREACLSVVQARGGGGAAPLDSVDLGEGVWCRAVTEDPGTRVQIDRAGPEALTAVLRDSATVARVLAERPYRAVPDLGEANPYFTVRGDGRVNLNAAPREVLAAVPGLGLEGAAAILAHRDGRTRLASAEEVLGVVPSAVRERILSRYPEFLAATTVRPTMWIVTVEGHVGAMSAVARGIVSLVPTGSRLAVVRREME